MNDTITLDHGSGTQLTSDLIEQYIVPAFDNNALNELKDGAILENENSKLVVSTDSFIVDPWKFPGGTIGKLAVCGTVNDICMAGGIPAYLSCSFIIEEGFPLEDFQTILNDMKTEAKKAGVSIVTGDTKVIEHQKGNQIFINTTGIGFLKRKMEPKYEEGDVVILSGSMGRHGAAVFMAREDIALQGDLTSDCALLKEKALAVMEHPGLRILRDPTRGGVATTCIELIEKTNFGMDILESSLPVDADVQTLCELLGFDPLYLACEGRMLAVVSKEEARNVLLDLGQGACIIGTITSQHPGQLHLQTKWGAHRHLRKPIGQPLPRIC